MSSADPPRTTPFANGARAARAVSARVADLRTKLLDPRLLRSAIGRRLLLLLAFGSIVPVAALSALSYWNAAAVLREDMEARLRHSAHGYGAAVAARLARIDRLLDAAAREPRPDLLGARVLAPLIGHELVGVAVVDRHGRPSGRSGDPAALGAIGESQLATLLNDRALLLAEAEPGSHVSLLRRLPAQVGEQKFLLATVEREWLWGDRSRVPRNTELCVVSSAGDILSCTAAVPGAVLSALAQRASAEATALQRWDARAGTFRSAASALDLSDRFANTRWVVVASQSESNGLAAARAQTLPLAAVVALALGAILALGIATIRRIVVPIEQLLAGTRRVEQGDFAAVVELQGADEFGQLGRAFNRMTGRLALQFGTLKALSQIDRAILKSLDLGEVAKNSLRSVRRITSADIVALGLLEPDQEGAMRVYIVRGDETTRAERGYATWNAAVQQQLLAAATGEWVESGRVPRELLALLKPAQRRACLAQPILRDDRFWGVVLLAHDRPLPLADDRKALLRGVADRLAVALTSAERDRRLHTMAHHDALTGLPNRHSLLDLLAKELAHARRSGSRVGVVFIDLDRFKQTNDTLGHAAGDLLLKQAAARIRQTLRESDTVGRHGGDEFTVVLGNLAAARDAGQVARELIKALSRPFEIEGHTVYAGASAGIAVYPEDGTDGADLLKKADTAMYRAKEHGRNRFAFFEERMNAEVTRRATLDRELRQAFERGEFVLHYQPQIDLRSGQVCAAEALIRWLHPERGLLYPSAFIPFAEESGLIDAIGSWVLREACLQHGRWRAAGVPVPRVSVNISNRQLRRSKFVQTLDATMVATQMPPDCLEIEVTESLFLDGGKAAIDALKALEEAGARVAIDDFGTGYSSFGYLKTLPASIIKLDRSFVTDVATDPDAGAIAAAIVKMAHMLRKEVVAEGVETFAQLDYLRQLACEKVQGYLFSRPLPPHEIEAFAHRRVVLSGECLLPQEHAQDTEPAVAAAP